MLNQTKISSEAEKVIQDYLNLPFADVSGVRCPYFNNARVGQRGQLKVLVGKGTPQEIVEEAKIIAIQYKQEISKAGLTAEHIRKFLIDHNLGIDCSGFISNVLIAQLANRGSYLTKKMFITPKTNVLRWLISHLRPVEQMNVKVYADNHNTGKIDDLSKIEAGDMVVMLSTGPKKIMTTYCLSPKRMIIFYIILTLALGLAKADMAMVFLRVQLLLTIQTKDY